MRKLRKFVRTCYPGLSLTFLLTAMLFCFSGHADSIYVWSNDGTIRKFDASGAALPFTSVNLSGWFGPVGLALDNTGNLYSGCPGESWIRMFSPDGRGGFQAGEVDSVSGLAFDQKGALYATIPNYGEVCKLRYIGWWVGPFDTNRTHVNLSSPVNMAFDISGNIYAANWVSVVPTPRYYDNTIQKFSPDLAFLETVATNLNEAWDWLLMPRVICLYPTRALTVTSAIPS